ncbi:MAG TPA: TonB-dependent receptor [Balneolaceae bacterium]|nr:TonB-dependent receptor [Balneolaceae bacterium]
MFDIKRNLTSIILLLIAGPLYAQSISGRVLDQQTQQPLMGVNIIVPGTTIGTATNNQGYFELTPSHEIEKLQISYIGYISKRIKIDEDQEFLNILLKPDNVALNEVQVVAFNSRKRLQKAAASVALITSEGLERSNELSLRPVLNTVAGVQMDQSNLGDSRISIRGVGIRANWGIRNIKIYVNGIPLTEADGVTRIEGLDVSTIGRVEIIKGPASSIYGAGTGGVINFKLKKAPYGESSIEAGAMAGSYGLNRLSATYRTGSDTFNAMITTGSQVYDGYRQHSHDFRRFFTGSLQFFPSPEQTVTVLVSQSRQEVQIPGDLNAAQVAENPRQANAGYVAKQAGRYQSWTRFGVAHTYDFTDQISNSTSVYTSFYDLDHPLPFAYIMQPYQSYGGRTLFTFVPAFNGVQLTFTIGGEYQNAITHAQRFINNQGEKGDLILNQKLNNTRYFLFLQGEVKLTDKTTLISGVSLNKTSYDITDFMNDNASGVKEFDAEWAPRFALTHVFSDKIALRAGVSYGFSPPTTGEITGADGHIREQVQAERGINYEIGARGNLVDNSFNYDITLFSFQMEDQLVPRTVGPNNTIYVNAGETSRNGLEVALSYFWSNKSSFINSIRPFVSYAYSDFTFEQFRIFGPDGSIIADYSGNDVTGISPHNLTAGIDLTTASGFYLYTTYFFNGKAPITDANSIYNDAYSLLNSEIGYESKAGEHFNIELSAGINNLLDEKYSSYIALNARSYGGGLPAFYNPAPGRNFYGSLSVSYAF